MSPHIRMPKHLWWDQMQSRNLEPVTQALLEAPVQLRMVSSAGCLGQSGWQGSLRSWKKLLN